MWGPRATYVCGAHGPKVLHICRGWAAARVRGHPLCPCCCPRHHTPGHAPPTHTEGVADAGADYEELEAAGVGGSGRAQPQQAAAAGKEGREGREGKEGGSSRRRGDRSPRCAAMLHLCAGGPLAPFTPAHTRQVLLHHPVLWPVQRGLELNPVVQNKLHDLACHPLPYPRASLCLLGPCVLSAVEVGSLRPVEARPQPRPLHTHSPNHAGGRARPPSAAATTPPPPGSRARTGSGSTRAAGGSQHYC